ncbi:hypothetical protein CYY_009918 [Polysphondylium violaceum]|uniref:Calponin-homology (CH) domain-containing protein n=1 Tax=Polysphondylium violaceum TaxID=133409 RepID=A0A8J4V2H8_9MYCE|nr:hypothetical protein CYY_009918 [Polysphondylium violaceum]
MSKKKENNLINQLNTSIGSGGNALGVNSTQSSGGSFVKSSSTSTMSPFSIVSLKNSPPGSPMSLHRFNNRTPPLENFNIKEKIQHLGWMGSPQSVSSNGRLRSNSMAIGSPGSTTFLQHQLDQIGVKLEEKEKDAQLAAEIGKMLLERNQELEDQILILTESEKKYIEALSQYDFLKNQNERLNENLKEATITNEMLVDQIKEEEEEKGKKFLSAHRSNSVSNVKLQKDIDDLIMELDQMRQQFTQKEKAFNKLRIEKEDLLEQISTFEKEYSQINEYNAQIETYKEKIKYLSIENKSLKSFSELNIKKSIIEEFNHLKDNFQISLDKLSQISNSMIKEYSSSNEKQLYVNTKQLLESIQCDQPIVFQVINRIQELDGGTVDRLNCSKEFTDDNNSSPTLETAPTNLIRSSILLIISLYLISKSVEFSDKLVKEKNSTKELLEDLNELKDKFHTCSKLNDKLELDKLENGNEIQQLKVQLTNLESTLTSLKDNHEKELQDLSSEKEKLQELLKSQSENTEQTDLIFSLKETISTLSNEVNTLLNEKEKILKDYMDSQSQIIEKEKIISNFTSSHSQTEESLSLCRKDLELKNNLLKEKSEELDTKVKELDQLSQNSFVEKDNLKNLLLQKNNEIEQLNGNNQALVLEIEKLKGQLQDVENKSKQESVLLNETMEKYKFESNQSSQELINQHQIKIQEWVDKYQNLYNEFVGLKDAKCQQCLDLKSIIEELKNQIEELKTQLLNLQQLKYESETKLENQLTNNLEKQQSVEKELLENHESTLKEMKDLLMAENSNVIDHIKNQHQLQINSYIQDIEKLKDDNQSLKDAQLKFDTEFNRFQQSSLETSSNCKFLEKENETLLSEISIFKDQLSKIDMERDLFREKENNISNQIQVLKSQVDEKNLQNSNLQQETHSLKLELESLKSLLSIKDNQIQSLMDLNSNEQEKIIKKEEIIAKPPIKEDKKEIEPTSSLSTIEPHNCQEKPLVDREKKLFRYINSLFEANIPLDCQICAFRCFNNGILFCNIINHFIPETIDNRALYKGESSLENQRNIRISLNCIKVLGGDSSFSTQKIIDGNGQEIINLTYHILFVGLLHKINLQNHPELVYLWKFNPEFENKKKAESWDSFIAYEPQIYLRKWINHYLKVEGKPIVKDLCPNTIFSDYQILACILKNIYPSDYQSGQFKLDEKNSIYQFILNKIFKSKQDEMIVFSDDIESNDFQKCLILLSQIFDTQSGLSLSKDIDCPIIEPDSPDLGPSSEEKACKSWLKTTIDINTSNLDDFQDGLLLLKALDKIAPGIVNWKSVNMNPTNTFSMTENCNYCVTLGKQLKFSLVGIAGKDFVDGIKKFLLSFVWQMMRYSVLRRVNLQGSNGIEMSESELISKMNKLVQKNSKKSSMKSFSDPSLRDGIFLLDLLDSIHHGSINYKEVKYGDDIESRKSNAKYIISVARRLGCTAIIFWEDIVEVKPNMIMTFLCDLMTAPLEI